MGYLKISVKPVSILFFLSLSLCILLCTVYLCIPQSSMCELDISPRESRYIYIHTHIVGYVFKFVSILLYVRSTTFIASMCTALPCKKYGWKDGSRPQLNSLTSADWCDEEPLHTALQLRGITRGAAGDFPLWLDVCFCVG